MPQVQLAANFFKKEREQNYTSWPDATWRELFQNSVDQDATEINIGLALGADGCVVLTFADNGPGMTRQVLNEVYFNIGASTKDHDPTKIGGMGRARVLTCFAMQSYRIYSQDYEVIGRGGQYDVIDHAWTSGCKLIIEVDGSDLDTMTAALHRFLYESRVTARVILNGERLVRRSLVEGRHIRNLEVGQITFARVWVNKAAANRDAANAKRVIVRVNGVVMFTTSTNANAQVVIEIEPSISRDVLTANRDGLRYDYRHALTLFLRELAVDTSSALRSRFGRRTTVSRGSGMKTIREVRKPASRSPAYLEQPSTPAPFFFNPQASPEVAHPDDRYTEQNLPEEFDEWLSRIFGDIYIFDETQNAAVRKVLPAYQPEHWTLSNTDRVYRRGGNIIRVLLLWHTAVAYAIEVALKSLERSEVQFAVGFVFPGDPVAADCRSLDGGHVFSLCPVDASGKLDFAVTVRRDLKRLMTLAKHEVTHVGQSWHGEEFSRLRESIDIAFDDMECLRRMKDALRHAKF